MLTEIRYDQISRHRHSQDYLSSSLIMSKIRVLQVKATLLLFLRKTIVSYWLLREIFLKNEKQCDELWTRFLRFWSASQFYVVAFLFLICRNHETYYNCSISLTKSGSRHCTLQRNYNAVPHESGREDITEFLSNLFTTRNNPVQLKGGVSFPVVREA